MTQHELIIEYIKAKGYIIPAKLNDDDRAFKGLWIGSQADKRCREMRGKIKGVWENPYGKQMVRSEQKGKYTYFYLLDAPKTFHPDKCIGDYKCQWYRVYKKCFCIRTGVEVKEVIKNNLF